MAQSSSKGCLSALFGVTSKPGSEPEASEQYPYIRKDSLLTPAEISFYRDLTTAVEGRCLICPMVRLADILSVRKGTESWRKNFNRIVSKHVDFVLADNRTLQPLLAIELDDKSHTKPDRQDRDTFVETACEAGGLPILGVPARASYNPEDLRRSIDAAIADNPR